MNCPRCGNQLAAQAAFCMHCGQPLAQSTGGGAAVAAPTSKRTTITAIVVVVALIAAIFGGLYASGALRATGGASEGELVAQGSTPSGGSLQASGSAPTGSLEARGSAPEPTLGRTGEKAVMPDDVRKWLEHLERIERRREDVSSEQLAAAIQMMTALQLGDTLGALEGLLAEEQSGEPAKSPAQSTAADIDKMRSDWLALDDDFASLPPPAECVPIARSYTTVLQETREMILDIVSQMDRAGEDRQGALTALMGMRGKSGTRIGKPARDSDDLVYSVCRKYDTRKWFSISSDFGGGLLGKMGF